MYVDYAGWTKEEGFFKTQVFVDENRTDHAVHFADGSITRQVGGFIEHTSDWNHDGDVSTKYGAWFEFANKEGSFSGGDFFTPEDLVRFAVDALDPDASSIGPKVTKVVGVTIPPKTRHENLDDRVRRTEQRAMHQDMERNRKMASLGIRPPNEPWAK